MIHDFVIVLLGVKIHEGDNQMLRIVLLEIIYGTLIYDGVLI